MTTKIASNKPSLDKNDQAVAPSAGDALRRDAKEAEVVSIVTALEERTGVKILGEKNLHQDPAKADYLREMRFRKGT